MPEAGPGHDFEDRFVSVLDLGVWDVAWGWVVDDGSEVVLRIVVIGSVSTVRPRDTLDVGEVNLSRRPGSDPLRESQQPVFTLVVRVHDLDVIENETFLSLVHHSA